MNKRNLLIMLKQVLKEAEYKLDCLRIEYASKLKVLDQQIINLDQEIIGIKSAIKRYRD